MARPAGRVGRCRASQFLAGVYGAYFGAGLGIMTLAILAIFVADRLQRLNALKGLLSLLINLVAAVFFALLAEVAWSAVVVMVAASLLGGHLGVVGARRLDDRLLRVLVIVFGLVVGVRLLLAGCSGGLMSNVIPVSRSETSHRVAMASGFRVRPNIGRRTGGPQFTQRGV